MFTQKRFLEVLASICKLIMQDTYQVRMETSEVKHIFSGESITVHVHVPGPNLIDSGPNCRYDNDQETGRPVVGL